MPHCDVLRLSASKRVCHTDETTPLVVTLIKIRDKGFLSQLVYCSEAHAYYTELIFRKKKKKEEKKKKKKRKKKDIH